MNASLIISIALSLAGIAIGFGIAMARNKYKKLREALARQCPITNASEDDAGESFWFGLSYSGIAALTAILIPLGLWFGLQGGLKWFNGKGEAMTNAPVILTLVVLAGVIGLLAVLMMTALAFSAVKLADKTQALGLPEGSVRAVIALSLIVIFVITVVFLFEGLSPRLGTVEHQTLEQANAVPASMFVSKHAEAQTAADTAAKGVLYTVERYIDPSRASEDFAKQIITTISTLVVSISAFYFGSTTAISAAKTGLPATSGPVITKQPADLSVKEGEPAEFSVQATGPNLSYQWQTVADTGSADISGATNNTHRIANVTTADNGAKFACKITNPGGTVTSRVATLRIVT
jgi:Immunoglobulin I-set domain